MIDLELKHFKEKHKGIVKENTKEQLRTTHLGKILEVGDSFFWTFTKNEQGLKQLGMIIEEDFEKFYFEKTFYEGVEVQMIPTIKLK